METLEKSIVHGPIASLSLFKVMIVCVCGGGGGILLMFCMFFIMYCIVSGP